MQTAIKTQTTTRRRSMRRRFCLHGDRSIQYTTNDQAYQITQGKNATQFWYAPNNQRYKRQDIFYQASGNIDPPPPSPLSTIGSSFTTSTPVHRANK